MARILVLDDDSAVLGGVTRFLEGLGHEVVAAPDGVAGLREFSSTPTDLVLTDINMPEMDGIEFLMEVQKIAPDVPVIVMSGGGEFQKDLLLGSAAALGAVSVIAKPFELEEMTAAIEAALDQSKA